MDTAGKAGQTARRNFFRMDVVQRLPIPLDAAWAFFSDPRNLREITPPELHLVVENALPSRMHAGMLIRYRVRPVWRISIHWTTEITHVEEGRLFVDEQRFGPYRFWHHQHHFHVIEGGVEMRDVIHYMLPLLGPLSFLADRLVVRPRLRHIFAYREEVLAQRFGRMADDAGSPTTCGG